MPTEGEAWRMQDGRDRVKGVWRTLDSAVRSLKMSRSGTDQQHLVTQKDPMKHLVTRKDAMMRHGSALPVKRARYHNDSGPSHIIIEACQLRVSRHARDVPEIPERNG